MFDPIVSKVGGYEARTDGSDLEIRRSNGVVVGQGRIGISQGAFHVGEYTGEVDENVYRAVRELLEEHESDIVARWIAAEREDAAVLN
jgi:hypothetical protein